MHATSVSSDNSSGGVLRLEHPEWVKCSVSAAPNGGGAEENDDQRGYRDGETKGPTLSRGRTQRRQAGDRFGDRRDQCAGCVVAVGGHASGGVLLPDEAARTADVVGTNVLYEGEDGRRAFQFQPGLTPGAGGAPHPVSVGSW